MNPKNHDPEIVDFVKRNLHIFRVSVAGHGVEEVAFQGSSRAEAREKFIAWLRSEHAVSEVCD